MRKATYTAACQTDSTFSPLLSSLLQRKCACGNHIIAGGECTECTEKKTNLQRQVSNQSESTKVLPIVHEVLNSPGHPLDSGTRAFMEPRFGHDFSQVRIHTDRLAAESAREVNALAYTVGRDVVFGIGQYAPQTADGQKLIAHELVHVAQPRKGGSRGLSRPGDPGEQEANLAADAFATGETVRVGTASGAAVQRQPLPGSQSAPATDSLIENASPFLAAALGSATLDNFDTGKSDIKANHKTQLVSVAHSIVVLLRKYNMSTVTAVGHTDTVGKEVNNLQLGQDRADAAKQALSDLGVPEAIISAESKGEGAPQAVKTKNEVPSGQNRRVEIRFHPKASNLGLMTPQLKLPSVDDKSSEKYDQPEKRPIDLSYRPKIEPVNPTKLPPDFWKPIPPPKGSGPKSPLDMIGEKILDPVIDAIAGKLPKSLRDKIKEGARKAVKSGMAKGARAVAEAAGIKDPKGLDAIEKAAEAAIQEQGRSPP